MNRKLGFALLTPVVLAATALPLVGCGSGTKPGPLVFTKKDDHNSRQPDDGAARSVSQGPRNDPA
jgi:hypothetical protein